MEQFSHDLTLALEETSRVRAGNCWGVRRRTRSTGNLPCAPQPTEDSSSSPGEGQNEMNDCQSNSVLSDSDDRQNFKLALGMRQTCLFGNFESDSLNENFSPTRPNTRRKRKFKRMAVEYETTPSTPGNNNPNQIFPLAGNVVKKRVMKHTSQENFRANLFFCGKRKRSHRDRYYEHDHCRLHSSSVPRQRDFFAQKSSYLEYKNRNRNTKSCDRILPLNKTIVSKIEKISQDSSAAAAAVAATATANINSKPIIGFLFSSSCLSDRNAGTKANEIQIPARVFKPQAIPDQTSQPAEGQLPLQQGRLTSIETISNQNKLMQQKSGSFESTFSPQEFGSGSYTGLLCDTSMGAVPKQKSLSKDNSRKSSHRLKSHNKHRHSKRLQMKMQLQFGDPNGMDCGNLNDFLSSSSLSSSDSEAAETNESDREGDDELTDWPGNEAMVNFASKNDFKRAKPQRNTTKNILPLNRGTDDLMGQDDDTLMSADELHISPNPSPFNRSSTDSTTGPNAHLPPNSLHLPMKFSPALHQASQTTTTTTALANETALKLSSLPIDITPNSNMYNTFLNNEQKQIESEMSGETSNPLISSPNTEVREIRAGCRRVHDDRPGFTIFTSVNEHLSRFLQDSRQTQLILPYTDNQEHDKLVELAKLYSLHMHVEDGRAIFTKTINTTQTVKINQTNMPKFLLSDYKRRCYGAEDDSESAEMAS